MSRTRKFMAGIVAMVALLGLGGAAQATSDSGPRISADRFCC